MAGMWSIHIPTVRHGLSYSFPGCLGPYPSWIRGGPVFEQCGGYSPVEAWVFTFTFLILLVCVHVGEYAHAVRAHVGSFLFHSSTDTRVVHCADSLAALSRLSSPGMSVHETQK